MQRPEFGVRAVVFGGLFSNSIGTTECACIIGMAIIYNFGLELLVLDLQRVTWIYGWLVNKLVFILVFDSSVAQNLNMRLVENL